MIKDGEFIEMKLFLNRKKSRYCFVRIYWDRSQLQQAYRKERPGCEDSYYNILGVHMCFDVIRSNNGCRMTRARQVGMILLSREDMGVGVVTHEISHAVLASWKCSSKTKIYPIVINNEAEEEDLLQEHTFAIQGFYRWYWDNESRIFPKSNLNLGEDNIYNIHSQKHTNMKKADKANGTAKESKPKASSDGWSKKQKILLKTFPNLTENDLHVYQGEEEESVLGRVAEKTGKTLDEIKELVG